MAGDKQGSIETWLTEFGRQSEGGGASAKEICAATGLSQTVISLRLQDLAAAGRLIVGRRAEKCITGQTKQVPVYTIRPESVKKNPKVKK